MTKGHRTIVALLAAVAVLLGINLLRGTPEAAAQVKEGITGSCCLPNGTCLSGGWTAAECAAEGGTYLGDGTLCGGPGTLCFPEPTVVSGVAYLELGAGNVQRVWRFWSDGTIDTSTVGVQDGGCNVTQGACGPVQIIPPPCPADVNDDLSVNVLDLIELLLAFGSTCPAAG